MLAPSLQARPGLDDGADCFELRDLHIAVVHGADPEDPRSYSGSPSHLLAALRELGVEVYPVSAAPPAPLAHALSDATIARWMATGVAVPRSLRERRLLAPLAMETCQALGWTARRRLAVRHPLDAAVVVAGSEIGPLSGIPYVAYEDMTVRQAARFPEWLITSLPARDLAARAALQQRQLHAARAVCTNTWWARDSVVEDYGIAPSKVHVVGFGGRSRSPGAQPDRTSRPPGPRFLHASRDWARKNGEVLLRAFALVHAEHPNATLDFVGNHPQLEQPGVRAHGLLSLEDPEQQRRLDALFSHATCFVMPSAVEPSGLSLVEAANCRLPSIVTSVGGAVEVIGGGGIAVKPGDVELLAEAMTRLCDLDLAERLGELAHRHVRQLSWELAARRILAALGWGPPMAELPRMSLPGAEVRAR